jgi:membrane-associated phospholipid phosphatase
MVKTKGFYAMKFISIGLSEIAIAFYLIMIFSFYGNLGNMSLLENILVGSFFMVFIPGLAVFILYRNIVFQMGLVERQQRPRLYLINMISYLIVSLIFNYFNNIIMLKISLSFLFTFLVLFLINFKWKISLHGAGIAIGLTVLFLNFGMISLPLLILVPFVYWLRLRLKAHSLYQLIAGSLVAFITTYTVFLSI